MTDVDFVHIVTELKKGNNEVLSIIYQQYSSYCIKPLIRKSSCTEEEGRDIFVEAVMNLREKILSGKVTTTTPIKSYLFNTCRNMWLKRLRQKSRYNYHDDETRFFDRYMHQEEADYDGLIAQEAEAEQANMMRAAKESLAQMDDKCKQLLTAFILQGKSMKDIAVMMGFANANVAKTIKSRCYKKLIKIANSILK